MATQTDPIQPTIVDANENNCAPLPLAEASNGFADNQVLTAEKFNRIARQASLFALWLDQNSQRIELSNGSTANCRLTATSLRYAEAAGLSQPVVSSGSYLIGGRLVQHSPARCAARGQSPHTFSPLKQHHMWLSADGSIRFQVVTIGDPASGLPGEVYAGFVITDATDVVQCEVPGDPFIATNLPLATQRNLIDVVTQFRGDTLTVIKESGSSAFLRFMQDSGLTSDAEGWYFEVYNTDARRFRLRQRISGVNYDCIDFGDAGAGTPMTLNRPAAIVSGEGGAGDYALDIISTDPLGKGSKMSVQRTQALTLEGSGTGGAPLCLVPRAPGFTVGAPVGCVEIGSDAASNLQYKDNNGVTRTVFAASAPHTGDGQYIATTITVSIGTLAADVNFDIVSGKKYRIIAAARIGRAAGSTRDCRVNMTIGGVTLPPDNHVILLFQAGAALQLEETWTSGEIWHTATVTGTVSVSFTLTPLNGAGNICFGHRSISIVGAYN